jgi:hypothetical protein
MGEGDGWVGEFARIGGSKNIFCRDSTPSRMLGRFRLGFIFPKVGPAIRPSRRFTSSRPSSRLASSAVETSPFVGESERLEKIVLFGAKNL